MAEDSVPSVSVTTESTEFHRSLSLIDSTLIVSGSMIGSGVFIVTADMARNLGASGWLLMLWVLTGVLTVAAALSYGELAGMMPKAGGQYIYLQRAFGPVTGFVYGWTVFMVIQTGTIAAVAVAFTKFTAVFIPALNPANVLVAIGPVNISAGSLFAISSLVLLTWINSRGIESGKLIQNVFTSAKLIALLGLIVIGITLGVSSGMLSANLTNAWAASTTSATGEIVPIAGIALMLAFGTSMVGSLFSADAWNNVTFIAGEIKNPRRNIPLALFFGTLIVTTIYFLANISYLSLLPLKGLPTATDIIGRGIQFAEADRVATAAVSTIFGNIAVSVMAVLIMVSTFGCNNGLILAGARLYYAMAKDGLICETGVASEPERRSGPGFVATVHLGFVALPVWPLRRPAGLLHLCFAGFLHRYHCGPVPAPAHRAGYRAAVPGIWLPGCSGPVHHCGSDHLRDSALYQDLQYRYGSAHCRPGHSGLLHNEAKSGVAINPALTPRGCFRLSCFTT